MLGQPLLHSSTSEGANTTLHTSKWTTAFASLVAGAGNRGTSKPSLSGKQEQAQNLYNLAVEGTTSFKTLQWAAKSTTPAEERETGGFRPRSTDTSETIPTALSFAFLRLDKALTFAFLRLDQDIQGRQQSSILRLATANFVRLNREYGGAARCYD